MHRLVKIASGWLAVEVEDFGDDELFATLWKYDQDGRCVREDQYDEELHSGAPAVASLMEEYGATPDEARAWADEFMREARAERESFEQQWSDGGRNIRAGLEILALGVATVGVWLVGIGFLVWLVVTRAF